MIKRFAAAVIVVILLLSAVPFARKAFAQETPTLFVDPPSIVDETLTPGNNFNVTIQVADIVNMYAYEFQLYYKTNVLNLSSGIRPAGNFLQPLDSANQFVAKAEINNAFNATHGRAWYGYTLLYPETGRSGSGILMQFSFKIVGVDSTPLTLAGDILVDDLGVEMPHDTNNGFFNNIATPPPPSPAFMYVDPASITDPTLTPSNNFSVSIKIINATNLFSFEFRLNYSATVLEALKIQEGNFLSSAGATSILQNQTDNVLGSLLFSVGLTTPPGASGDGTLATIVFKVIANGTTTLNLNNIILKDSDNQILSFTKSDGSFSNLIFKPGDINKDGVVNLLDLVEAALSFGKTSADPPADSQNHRGWKPDADMDHDNKIDISDLDLIVFHWSR